MLNYRDLIRTLAGANGTRIAIDDDRRSYTYTEVHVESSALAAGFRAQGLATGEVVMWLSPNRAEYLICYYATAKAGLIFAPLNYWLRPQELEAAIALVRPKCVIVHPEYVHTLDKVLDSHGVKHKFVLDDVSSPPAGWEGLSRLYDRTADVDDDFGGGEHLLHELIFTSGTTGQVKGVVRTQRQRIMEALMSVVAHPQGKQAHVLRGAPQFHVGGATGPLQTMIQGGRTTIFRFKPEEQAARIRAGATHISGVPAMYSLLFESRVLEGVDTSRVRYCSIGGNGASPAQFLEIQEAFPNATLVHFYGSTESGLVTSISGEEFMKRLTSVGRPSPGVDVRIVDDEGRDVPRGEVGEIWVRSEFQMTEYYGRPDLTSEAVTADGFLKMGDLGRLDEEGYLYIAGRKKDMIITGGENVYPKEVEDVICAMEEIAEAAVIGVPDERYEERVVALVKPTDASQAVAPSDLPLRVVEHVRHHLAGYKAPKEVYVVTDFPRNALGKVDKVQLRRNYGEANR